MKEVKIPSMGESITEATVSEIIKESGSLVRIDDEILELETDKVNQVIYATETGVLTLKVAPDETVTIGQVIATIEPKDIKEEKKEVLLKTPVTPKPSKEGIRKTKEHFIASIGEKKEIPSSRDETRKKLPRIRQVIGERLLNAVKTTAMLTTFNEVDMSQVMAIRSKNKNDFIERHGVKLGFMSFFVKAVVSALYAYPSFNTYIDGDELVQRHYLDIGIAVGTEKGLVVPVVKNSDKLSFAGIEKEIIKYAKRAHEGKLAADDLTGGCFTITNGGTYGSMLSTPILNPPQCGILGMHNIVQRPVVVDGQIVIRPIMYLALSYDHRVVDGKEAVSFLVHIKNELEDPSRLILDI
ncbi:dihydrolipoyllysine-residue succinyltransferase [Chlamydiales bacterium]|nr:dihydrolipoyllysine-residue succinyltransferase [Chlamydiales bacterium]